MIRIQEVANGWMAFAPGDGTPTIFESGESELDHAKSVQRLLYWLLSEIDEYGTKHDPYRVRVVIESADGSTL